MGIKPSYDRHIPTAGFPILVRRHLHIELAPRFHHGTFNVNSLCQFMQITKLATRYDMTVREILDVTRLQKQISVFSRYRVL